MKTIKIKLLVFMLPLLLSLGSCEDYLTIPSEAAISEEQVFSTYNLFQGYIDQMYPNILDHNRTYYTCTGEMGGEAISPGGNHTSYRAVRGNYAAYLTRGYYQTSDNVGIWQVGWKSIRMCNNGLKNLDNLTATPEQKNWIKGQLLFFRAYFHLEILHAWGPIPYINQVIANDFKLPRYYDYKGKKNFQATTEYIVDDLTEAAQLLPLAWPDPVTNLGKHTALAAISYKAKALLYAGSPLMNENSGNAAEVNIDYMTRAAAAADEAIKMAEANPSIYGLMDKTEYFRNFATTDRTVPWTKETVLALHRNRFGSIVFSEYTGRSNTPHTSVFGGNAQQSTPTQNYVDRFEMADGTLYDPAIHDGDNAKRWASRDPRFLFSIYVDRDIPVTGQTLEMYMGGKTRNADGMLTPYVIKKYWPFDVSNTIGNVTLTNNYTFSSPQMRLAEVYLMYAEATNWAYGNGNNGDAKAPGATYTALEAVNKIRTRIGHVPTTATGGAHGNFHKMVMNERSVEMCYESNHFWNDIRRYKIGESLNQTDVLTLEFDKLWTPASFVRKPVIKFTFEKRNYWLPFDRSQTVIYDGFPQNEGWD